MNPISRKSLVLLLQIGASSIFSQNLIVNGSFEKEDASWRSEGDMVECHHHSTINVKPVHGEYYVELANNKGYKLFQKIPVVKGNNYTVSFYTRARPGVSERESHFTLNIDGKLTAQLQPKLGVWEQYSYTVQALDDELTLSFEDAYYGAEGIGAMVDVVDVRPASQDGFLPIFDGETLAGWKVYASEADIAKNYWTVDNQSITCNTMGDKNHGAVWLFYEEELTDFELKVKFQAYRNSPGNSGLQVRSRYYEGGDIDGPQFDIHPPTPFRTGLLYNESDGYNRWIYPSLPDWNITPEQGKNHAPFYYADDTPAWNEFHIICKGTQIQCYLNGVLVTNLDGKGILDDAIHKEQNVGMNGKIALQVHASDEIHLRFKDILLKKLK